MRMQLGENGGGFSAQALPFPTRAFGAFFGPPFTGQRFARCLCSRALIEYHQQIYKIQLRIHAIICIIMSVLHWRRIQK
jgi:hypothetical protein